MRSVGIDIGSISIKIAEVETSSTSYVLRDFVELPLTTEPGVDNRIEIVDHLRKISAHFGNQVRYVFSIPQERLAVRSINFPFKQKHNILRSLPAELEDDIPFDQDSAVFDAKIVRTSGNTAETLAFACPKGQIEELLKVANEAGIEPDIVSVDTAVMSNIFETYLLPPREIPGPQAIKAEAEMATVASEATNNAEQTQGCQLILNIGHRRTLIAVIYRNTLLTTRTISRGGHDIVEGLRRGYNLPYVEALKGLQEKGFILTSPDNASQDQIEFSSIISAGLKPLSDELKLTLLELKSQLGTSFTQVLLTGGVSRMMNITPYMTRELEIPCNLLRHLERIPKVEAEMSAGLEFGSLPAIGLAIEGLKRPRNPAVNLLRGDFGKQSQTFKVFMERWGSSLKVAGLVLALFYVYSFLRSDFASSLEAASRKVLSDTARDSFALKGPDAREQRLRTFIREKRQEIEAKKAIAELQGLNSGLDIVKKLSENAPDKNTLPVDVRTFMLKNDNLIVEGEITTRAQAELVRGLLQSISVDRQVAEMTPTISPKAGRLVFAYKVRVARK